MCQGGDHSKKANSKKVHSKKGICFFVFSVLVGLDEA